MGSEIIHHGQVIQAYRRSQGLTQEELAQRIGRSRRTIVSLEQQRSISNIRVRRALALVLMIPPHLLDLKEQPLPGWSLATPLRPPSCTTDLPSGKMEMSTLLDNVRLRFDLYYFTNARYAAEGLREQRENVIMLAKQGGSSRTRQFLLTVLSHLYRLEGMIARDTLDYSTAQSCFQQASLAAQEASCPELEALSLACYAVLHVRQHQEAVALQCYDAARVMARHASPALKAYLATGYAEAQSLLKDEACFRTLEQAHRWLRLIDPAEDPLLLYRSTRCSQQALTDCWMACQAALGHIEVALEYYSDIDRQSELAMPRMQARMLIQCARLLYQNRDMSCCFYAAEGFRRAKLIDSHYNMQQVRDLALTLKTRFPNDRRVQELIELIGSM